MNETNVKSKAAEIVASLIEAVDGEPLVPTGTYEKTMQALRESPQYVPDDYTYRDDSKFVPVSKRNYSTYVEIYSNPEFNFTVDSNHRMGFVISKSEMNNASAPFYMPVLVVHLRDTKIKGYKQAHGLRIRKAHARIGIAAQWYVAYAKKFGGIVSGFEHLEGGKNLWRSFVDKADTHGLKISYVDSLYAPDKQVPVDANTPDSDIWTTAEVLRQRLLFLERQT